MYRVSYRDVCDTARLVAVTEGLAEADTVVDQIVAMSPAALDRMTIVEDPLAGTASRVVQPPENLDAAMGMSVVYLGGTTSAGRNWQAEAISLLRAELVVIANPRREHPTVGDGDTLDQIAWQQRHLWRADIGLFWFEGDQVEPTSMIELGSQLSDPVLVAIGAAPDLPWRTELSAAVGHLRPDHLVHDSLPETVNAVVELVRDQSRRRPFRLPHHDISTAASATSVQFAIVRVQNGPGLNMRLNELVIEVACAAGYGVDPRLLAKIYMGVDRLRLDADDPLGWAELLNVGHALENY